MRGACNRYRRFELQVRILYRGYRFMIDLLLHGDLHFDVTIFIGSKVLIYVHLVCTTDTFEEIQTESPHGFFSGFLDF